MLCIMWAMRSLWGWLYWEEGLLVWLRSRNMMLKLYINMNVSVPTILVCSTTKSCVYN